MTKIDHLIAALSQFPRSARVKIVRDMLSISNPACPRARPGIVFCPDKTKPRKTQLGAHAGWGDATAEPAAVQLCRFLQTHPEAALAVAMKAVEGLYINQADGLTMLTGDAAYPRGSGADFVEDVGQALEAAGMVPLIDRLQAEQEQREED